MTSGLASNGLREQLAELLDAWAARTPSSLSEHDAPCCVLAKDWFLAMDRSYATNPSASKMPAWIREHYKWGPNRWPLYWCEAVRATTLDCGALAALTQESLRRRGIRTWPAQLTRLYDEHNSRQWAEIWRDDNISCGWVAGPFVYHEACAIIGDGEQMELWDPTGNYWFDPTQGPGYSSPIAICLSSTLPDISLPRRWGRHYIPPNIWFPLI